MKTKKEKGFEIKEISEPEITHANQVKFKIDARGAFHSVVNRVMEIDVLDNEIILTGGVIAHNPTIVDIFEEELGRSVSVPPFPQLFVALGAALYALEEATST